MIRTRCSAVIDHKQCTKTYRSRTAHQFCRVHHRALYQTARPIESRETLHGMNRRTKSRRSVLTKQTPKVIQNRNKKDKNAIS